MLEEINMKLIFGTNENGHFALIGRQILIPLFRNKGTS